MKIISHHDTRNLWHGHISLHQTDDWTQPWRLPFEQIALFPPEGLREKAAMAAGVRLAFHSDSISVAGEIEETAGQIDLFVDGEYVETLELAGKTRFQFDGLATENKLIELWLPQGNPFRLRTLEIDDEANLQPYSDNRPRWTTYGSSITHCGAAQSPAYTWPAIAARERNVNLTCLGFGGQCHLDSMIARLIRDRDADFISLCLGINMHGGSVGVRAFQPAIIGFVQIIREKHPHVPLLLMSPIYSPPRETNPNATGWTLPRMREEVQAAYQALRDSGDENVHYLDGLKLFGPEHAHLLPDGLHPNGEGYKQMGRNFLDLAGPVLFDE